MVRKEMWKNKPVNLLIHKNAHIQLSAQIAALLHDENTSDVKSLILMHFRNCWSLIKCHFHLLYINRPFKTC